MTDEESLSQWLAGGLSRMITHVLFMGAIAVLLVIVFPQLRGYSQIQPDRAADPAARQVSARGATFTGFAALGGGLSPDDVSEDVPAPPPTPASILPLAADGYLLKSPQVQTIIPKRPRKELINYTVQAGDNLSTIAERYEVDVDTLIWANDKLEEDPDYLVVDQKLFIPPVSGVLYTVKDGDKLDAIAKTYKGDLRTMLELEYNRLTAATIPVSGTKIMIPGGEKQYQPRLVYIDGKAVMVNAPRGGGRFMWPTQGYISSYWSPDHRALDIAAPIGTPIYASDAGVVVSSGWMGDYGYGVLIDHGNGFQTLYAHFSSYYPSPGQNVRRGQAIGKMGSTGKSTGPHLHFEIRYQGGFVNPLRYLPQ
jgi:murein DD-endopeptidase MepM/ murein hydrolase activator NlpD